MLFVAALGGVVGLLVAAVALAATAQAGHKSAKVTNVTFAGWSSGPDEDALDQQMADAVNRTHKSIHVSWTVINGNYTQSAPAGLATDYDTQPDSLTAGGPALFGGPLSFSTGVALASGSEFTLFNYGGRFGTFGPLTLPSIPAGLSWTPRYRASSFSLRVQALEPCAVDVPHSEIGVQRFLEMKRCLACINTNELQLEFGTKGDPVHKTKFRRPPAPSLLIALNKHGYSNSGVILDD